MGLFGEVGAGIYLDTDSGTLSVYGSTGWLTPTTPGLFGGIDGGIEPDLGFYWDDTKFYGDGHEGTVSLGGPFSGNAEFTDTGEFNGVCWTPGSPFTGVGSSVSTYPTEVTPLLTIIP